MTGFNSKRRMALAKLPDDDDTQVYADTLLIVYQRGFADGKAAALEQPEQEPTPWRDMVVVSLVREGINKHKARELADHFAAQPEPPPEWEAINNIIAEYGLDAIAFVAEWKAAQRPWVGLTSEEVLDLFDRNNVYGSKWIKFARTVEAKLKEKNDY